MTAKQKALALCLYTNGLSFRTIGKIIRIHFSAVYRFIRKWAEENYEKPEPSNDAIIMLELDEMWHYLHSKKQDVGYGRLIAVIPVNLLTGNVEGETLLHLSDFLTE
jgi:hypothetical protein